MTDSDLDRQAESIHTELEDARNSDEFDPSHAQDMVYDVFIGNVPKDELAEKCVDLEFEHPDGPGTLYMLEETVDSVLTEWIEMAIPEEFSEHQQYIFNKYWDDVLDLAEDKFSQRKGD